MVDHARHYAALSDEELLILASQEASLLEAARSALWMELTRRGLQSKTLGSYREERQRQTDAQIYSGTPTKAGEWVKVLVRTGTLRFPSICPSCLVPNPDAQILLKSEQHRFAGYRVFYIKYKYRTVWIPYCSACARRLSIWMRVSTAATLLGLMLCVAIMVSFNLDRWAASLLIIPLCGPGIWASTSLGHYVRLVHDDENSLELRFKSPEYANHFHQLNRRPGD
jgi:hypothetical protein